MLMVPPCDNFLIFILYLLCTQPCSEYFSCIFSLSTTTTKEIQGYYYPHLNEKTEVQRGSETETLPTAKYGDWQGTCAPHHYAPMPSSALLSLP